MLIFYVFTVKLLFVRNKTCQDGESTCLSISLSHFPFQINFCKLVNIMYNCAGEVHSGWTSTDHGPQTQHSEYVCYCSCWSRYGTPRSFENKISDSIAVRK